MFRIKIHWLVIAIAAAAVLAGGFVFAAKSTCGASFYQFPSGGGQSPFERGLFLSACPFSASLVASPSSGNAPLNNVSLTAYNGGATGVTIRYQFDCTSDGFYEADVFTTSDPYTATNLCNYSTGGTYNAYVLITRWIAGGYSASAWATVSVFPAAPTGFTGQATTDTNIRWSWNSVSGAEFYRVYRVSDNLQVSGNITGTFWNETVSQNTAYSRYVRACISSGCGPNSSSASVTTTAQPTNMGGTLNSETQITWTWTDNATTEGWYKVFNSNTSPHTLMATLATNTTSWIESPLTPDTTYYRYAITGNSTGTSSPSTIAVRTTLRTPTGFSGSPISETTIRWQWTDNSTVNTGYRVFDSGGGQLADITSGTATSWDEGGRVPGVNYSRYVRAYNANNESLNSNTASASTSLVASTLSSSQLTETSIRWSWNDPSGEETGYRVMEPPSTDKSGALAANTIQWDEGTSTPLVVGQTYTRFVRRFNAVTFADSATSSRMLILNAPTGFFGSSVAGNPTALDWSFTDNSTQETHYRIYECVTNDLKIATTTGTGSGTGSRTIRETGLIPSTIYCRYAKVYKSTAPETDESSASNQGSAITGAGYAGEGFVTSAIFDTLNIGGAAYNYVLWQGSKPAGTRVDFQFASSNATSGPWTYVGDNCATATRYTDVLPNVVRRINMACHTGHRYFRYKVWLVSITLVATPTIDDIIIGWSP